MAFHITCESIGKETDLSGQENKRKQWRLNANEIMT